MVESHIHIGRDKLFSLLRKARLLVPCRREFHKTTQNHNRFHCHPNLLKEDKYQVKPVRSEYIWVADIIYLPVRTGEAYSRKIVGYHVDDSLRADSVAQAFKAAMKQRQGQNTLVHHSVRGILYCSTLYQAIHEKYGVTCSMTDGYDCYQNALAERINGILKMEYLISKPNNLEDAKNMMPESVLIYNQRRPI